MLKAVEEIERGLIDAELGGHIIKKRIARSGSGKRSGYRTLIATNKNNKWFFMYGFAKNERENIDPEELTTIKKTAHLLLLSDDLTIDRMKRIDELREIKYENKSKE